MLICCSYANIAQTLMLIYSKQQFFPILQDVPTSDACPSLIFEVKPTKFQSMFLSLYRMRICKKIIFKNCDLCLKSSCAYTYFITWNGAIISITEGDYSANCSQAIDDDCHGDLVCDDTNHCACADEVNQYHSGDNECSDSKYWNWYWYLTFTSTYNSSFWTHPPATIIQYFQPFGLNKYSNTRLIQIHGDQKYVRISQISCI